MESEVCIMRMAYLDAVKTGNPIELENLLVLMKEELKKFDTGELRDEEYHEQLTTAIALASKRLGK